MKAKSLGPDYLQAIKHKIDRRTEPMATKRLTKSSTSENLTKSQKLKAIAKRATSTDWIPGSRKVRSASVQRKPSTDSNTFKNLFPRTSRTNSDELLPTENWSTSKVDQPVKLMMGDRGPLAQKPVTIMSVLRLNVEKYPERQAYAYRANDTWEYITYKDLLNEVKRVAKGFISFGLERFSGVAILGYNSLEWVIANFAAIYAGGIAVPIHTKITPDNCLNVVQSTRCDIVVVGSSEQLDIVAQLRHHLLDFKAIIMYGKDDDPKSVHFHTWEQLIAMGDAVDDERFKERITYQAPNLCCTIIHTPGSSGPPKGVMLSHDNLVWTARAIGRRLNCGFASGVFMGISSFNHVAGLVFHIYLPLLFASTVYFVKSSNVMDWTTEVQPTIVYAPFLLYDELRLKLRAYLAQSCTTRFITWLTRAIALRGYRNIQRRRLMPLCWSLANVFVHKNIRRRLGLQNCRELFVAGRHVSVETLEFFASLNLPVLETYGMTETSGPHAVSAIPANFRITSVGKELDGCSTKFIQQDKNGLGEMQIRGRHVCMGYLNQPELTDKTIDKEGWLKTDDLARKDEDGFLYFIGRISDLVILENGETISPEPIESRVREELVFIRNCMLVGTQKPYLALLLTIKTEVNWETFEVSNTLTSDSRRWFRKLGYEDESIDKFLQNPDKKVLDEIQATIDRLNTRAKQPSHRIQKWTILPKDFSVHGGELTWTLKVRRDFVQKMYAETIDSMFVEK